MILYLSLTQHTNLLDFTGLYDNDTVTIKKMVGNFVLKQFIIYDMRNFSHCTDLILDRPAFGDSDNEFAEAIEEFLTMYSARITVIYEGLEQSSPLFVRLLDIGVGNIVTSTEIGQIQTEIRECLSDTGMVRYNPKERVKPKSGKEHYKFECNSIRIAVLSSQSRMGATTVAIGLTTWLHHVGSFVCYVESNQCGHLAALAKAYEMDKVDNGFIFEGVNYLCKEPEKSCNFIIHDIGNEHPQNKEIIAAADILLMCCGVKPYEMQNTLRFLRQFETNNAFVVCSFVDDNLKDNYALALQSDYHKLIFMEYQPDIMNIEANSKNYKGIIQKYIVGA